MASTSDNPNVCSCLLDVCNTFPSRPRLRVDDGCFVVEKGADTLVEFCDLENFVFPTDSFEKIMREVGPPGSTGPCAGELTLFDNEVISFSPSEELDEDCTYARGIVLIIDYPEEDLNGEEIELVDQNARLQIYDDAGGVCNIPVHSFFSVFNNPETTDPSELINKIVVVNPNDNYALIVKALVIYTKTNGEG